jgi:hypothetical protein
MSPPLSLSSRAETALTVLQLERLVQPGIVGFSRHAERVFPDANDPSAPTLARLA